MPSVELPHTHGCLVCGHDNPHGLHLHFYVDEHTEVVTCRFTVLPHQIGFEGIAHGGLVSTVLDEAMVWAATWTGKRFCVCGEMSVRFRDSVRVGQTVQVEAKVVSRRSRLITVEATVRDGDRLLVEASGKYVPVPPERNRQVINTLVSEPNTSRTMQALAENAGRSA